MKQLISYLISILEKYVLVKILLGIFFILSVCSFLILIFEVGIENTFDAFYWAIVTISTVGYGDITPGTVTGKIVTIILIFAGMILVSLFTATISSILIEQKLKEGHGLDKVNFKSHTILCGWNWNAEEILKTLFSSKPNIKVVIINELKPEDAKIILEKFRSFDLRFVRGDYSTVPILEKAGIVHAENVIIIPDSTVAINQNVDEKSIFATMTIKSISQGIHVYAHVLDKEKIPYFKRAKVDEVFLPDRFSPFFLTSNIIAPGLNDVLADLFENRSKETFYTSVIPNEFIGKKFSEFALWNKKRDRSIVIALVQLFDVLKMKNIDASDNSSLDAFIKRKFEKAGRLIKDLENKKIMINPDDDYIIQEHESAVMISGEGRA